MSECTICKGDSYTFPSCEYCGRGTGWKFEQFEPKPPAKPYDFSDSPFPVRFDIGDTVRFVIGTETVEGEVFMVLDDALHVRKGDTIFIQNKTACMLVRKANSQPAEVATLAKYFYRLEATIDGQKVIQTLGFQTHAELLLHQMEEATSEETKNSLRRIWNASVAGTPIYPGYNTEYGPMDLTEAPDRPTIREASE